MILFVLSAIEGANTGLGGHYYSAYELSQKMGGACRIVVVGDFFPGAYRDKGDVIFVECKKPSTFVNRLKDYSWYNNINCVHVFDLNALKFGSCLASKLKVSLVQTKAGGNKPKFWHPRSRNIITFHGSDYDYFSTLRVFRPHNLEVIPNRVGRLIDDSHLRADPFVGFDDNSLKILRICRIGPKYRESVLQAINLRKHLLSLDLPAVLVVIGGVDNAETLSLLKKEADDGVRFLFDSESTFRSSDYIPYSDVVVGTGRSAIEGMAHSKKIFFPVFGSDLPCFLTESNYLEAIYENFSPRIKRSHSVNPEKALHEFVYVYNNRKLNKENSDFVYKLFVDDFYSGVGVLKLKKFYASSSQRVNVVDVMIIQIACFIYESLRVCTNRVRKTRNRLTTLFCKKVQK